MAPFIFVNVAEMKYLSLAGLRGCPSRGEAVHHSESLLLMQTMYKEGCLSKPAKESLVLFSEVSSIGSFSSRTERGMLRDLESESI
jgi:hypothetical protein